MYGSRVFVRVPEEKRKSKWDRKADLGILLGYDSVGYRILINNKIVISRHIEIIEENVNLVGFRGKNIEKESINDFEVNNDLVEKGNIDNINNKYEIETENYEHCEEKVEMRKWTRKTKKADWYGVDSVNSHYIFVNYVNADSPITVDDVLKSEDCELWKQAMKKEINVINKNKTWALVNKPRDKKVLDFKMDIFDQI